MASSDKLLILDLNGCLCAKVSKDEEERLHELFSNPEEKYIERRVYYVFARPGVEAFVRKCMETMDVGIFTSTTEFNARPIIEFLFPDEEMRSRFVFFWNRDRTRLDPDFGTCETVKKYDTIKVLDDIFCNPMVNASRTYGFHNTIICDNSKRKVRLNPNENVFVWQEYNAGDNAEFTELIDKVDTMFAILNKR